MKVDEATEEAGAETVSVQNGNQKTKKKKCTDVEGGSETSYPRVPIV